MGGKPGFSFPLLAAGCFYPSRGSRATVPYTLRLILRLGDAFRLSEDMTNLAGS